MSTFGNSAVLSTAVRGGDTTSSSGGVRVGCPAVATALAQIAIGYRHKTAGLGQLIDAIEQAAVGDEPLDPGEYEALLEVLAQGRIGRARSLEAFMRLTDRERATLQPLAHGLAVHQISREWVVSEATVRNTARASRPARDERARPTYSPAELTTDLAPVVDAIAER